MPEGSAPSLPGGLPDFEFAFETRDGTPARDDAYRLSHGIGGPAPRDGDTMDRFALDGHSPVELAGSKRSQRSEMKETSESDDANQPDQTLWYSWSVYIDPSTAAPGPGVTGQPAKLHLGQFHQRTPDGGSAKPAIMFNLLEDGSLVAQFEQAVGKRAVTLIDGGPAGLAAKGQWIDLIVSANWSDSAGTTDFWVRTEGQDDYRLVAQDAGPNTSTGSLYFKYGVYRSHLERDPWLEQSEAVAYFDALDRAPARELLDLPAPWDGPADPGSAQDLEIGTYALPPDSFIFDLG